MACYIVCVYCISLGIPLSTTVQVGYVIRSDDQRERGCGYVRRHARGFHQHVRLDLLDVE